MVEYTVEHLKLKSTTPYLRTDTPNNDKWLQAVVDAVWLNWETERDIVIRDMRPSTAIGPALDRHASALQVYRLPLEVDASLRLRLYGAIRRRLGGTTPDAILYFLASAIGAPESSFTLIDNMSGDDTTYLPAYYSIQFDITILGGLGFTEDQYLGVIATLNSILSAASASGVRGEIIIAAGAEWDSAIWDDSDAIWSS